MKNAKKAALALTLLTTLSFVLKAEAADKISITSIRSGTATASASCTYPGVENEVNNEGEEIAGGAYAGSIELEVRNNRVTKLDSRIAGTNCRVSLGAFKQENIPGSGNIVLKNSDQCAVVINFNKESVVGADGVVRSGGATSLKDAVISFGIVAVEGGGCEKLCPELKVPKKFWQVNMNPRTNECTN